VGDAVIDLGEVPAPGRERTPVVAVTTRRPVPYRAVLGGLAALLVAMSTGAAHRGPPPPPTVIDARLGDTMIVGVDRMFVVGGGPAAAHWKIISEYALPDGDLVSRTQVALPGAVFDVASAGNVLLVSYQADTAGAEATVALVPGGDRALWRRPSRLLAVSAPDGLVLLRENSPDLGGVDWHGIDLATGAVRWSLRQPVRGFTTTADAPDGFPRRLVSATDTGELEVRDTATGAVLATAAVPVRRRPAGADVPVWSTGDLVLVGTLDGTTAYTLPGLTERWRSPVDLAGRWVQEGCAAICALSWQGGLRVLDRATGRELWADDRWNYVDQIGPDLVATDNTGAGRSPGVSVVDPGTGRLRGTLGAWQPVGGRLPDGTVHGVREELADDTIWYARLDPRTLSVRVLGRAERVSGDCRITAHVLVCRRIDATVGIWRLK
jgi:hypothetical protein